MTLGKSLPHSSISNNTTWDLVSDLEKLRVSLGIQDWIVFGGSWGSTLALAYAISNPEHIKGLILRGIFLGKQEEVDWYYQSGANHVFPDEWEKFIAPIPVVEQQDIPTAYYNYLRSDDAAVRQKFATIWSGWGSSTMKLQKEKEAPAVHDDRSEALARIECHYIVNHSFLESDNWILENISKIRHITAVIIHGRYDMACPVNNAWSLHKAWPEARLEIIPCAGHSSTEPGVMDALIRATDHFAQKEPQWKLSNGMTSKK